MKKSNIVIYISEIIVLIAIVFALISESIGAIIASLITTIITTFGAVIIWIQLKKTSVKVSSELVVNMNNILLKSPGLINLRDKLSRTCDPKDFSEDGKINGKDTTRDLENFEHDDSVNIIEYLEFFENMGAMYFSNTVTIRDMDRCFGDMFFVAMNNTYIQNREIIPYKEHYQTIIRLYAVWFKYRKKHGLKMPYEDTPLDPTLLLEVAK